MSALTRIVGESIRRFRTEAGLTQKTLAERVGITVKTLSSIETGKRSPSLSLIE
ncbi:MAG: helix-turn-helix transcriptional regulator [Planctomycetota bacterium]